MHSISDIELAALHVCVPPSIERNLDIDIADLDAAKLIKVTGIKQRRTVSDGVTAADLCRSAAESLLDSTGVDRADIGILVFVTQTPDYFIPATVHKLQAELGLAQDTIVLQVNQGCSGFTYGMFTISSMMSALGSRAALLLCGDTISKTCGHQDKSTRPLFGDAGTAALFKTSQGSKMYFDVGGNGKAFRDIIIPGGAYANEPSFGDHVSRDANDLHLDGMNVFQFGISTAPKSVNALLDTLGITTDVVDYFVFHQANKMMNEKIRKKIGLDVDKVPYSLPDYGNTSSASIPVTMASKLQSQLSGKGASLVLCGFGVGVSWATAYLPNCQLKSIELVTYGH